MSDTGITIPESEMRKLRFELERRMKTTKKTLAEVVNYTAQDMAFKAVGATAAASREEIAQKLGQIGNQISFTKKGKMKRKKPRLIKEDSYAARIINSLRLKAGEKLLFGEAMEKAVNAFINSKQRAVGFVKSGWIASIRELASRTGSKVRLNFRGVKQYGRPKGYATPAKDDIRPEATIGNTATNDSPKAAAVAQAGLVIAAAEVTSKMKAYTDDKMQKAMDKL